MVNKFTYRDITWIDLESPTPEEVQTVATTHGLHQVVAQELLSPTLKPKVDIYLDYFYLVLHFPAIRHSHTGPSNQEIDFIVGKNVIITTHYDTIDPLHEFSKIFEVHSITDRGDMGDHAGFVFYYMLKHIYKGMAHELDSITERISHIETNIFSGKETEMVREISKVSRDILDLKIALRPHHQVLDSLEVGAMKLFGEKFAYHLRDLKNEGYRIGEELMSYNEMTTELRDTNDSLVSTKQNEVMKHLAVIAFIALPIGILGALFQIDTVSRPIVGMPGDFWIILFVMILVATLLYQYAKSKKWL